MIDIVSLEQGQDMGLYNSQTSKAANILSVQLGSLEYEPDFGIDLQYFLSEEFRFENESFKAYLVQVLSNNEINVKSITEAIGSLSSDFEFNLAAPEDSGTLIAR